MLKKMFLVVDLNFFITFAFEMKSEIF